MVHVDAQTAKLATKITGSTPAAVPDGAGGLDFTTRELNALGQVTLRGTPGEPCAGWALGFFQLQFVETNRAHYRGAARTDGSVLVKRDRAPARPRQLCRDTHSTTVPPAFWYNPPAGAPGHALDDDTTMMVLPAGATIPATGEQMLVATIFDSPAESYPVVQMNALFAPPRVNSLHSVTIGFAFCTVLAVADPGGSFLFLKHFYWNCRWRAHFGTGGAVTGPSVMDINVQKHIHSGVPTDPHFNRASLLDVTLPTCNAVANGAAAGVITPSLHWT